MPQLEVEFDAYPGGWPAWRRAFKRNAATYYREHVEPFLPGDDDVEPLLTEEDDVDEYDVDEYDVEPPPMTPGHYAHQQLYYEVKSRVNAAAHQVASQAGISHRDLSIWLVKERGFPWRQDCLVPDLLRLLAFLQNPNTVTAVRSVPNYPERRSAAGPLTGEIGGPP